MSNDTRQTPDALRIDGTPLAGQSALVTGASSGIGAATAVALARAGARVGLVARRAERLEELSKAITGAGGQALALPADVTDYDQADGAIGRMQESFGGVDILVNVAGVMLPAPIAEADPADWQRMVQVNLMGALHCTRAVLPGMLARGSGHVVNVSSTSGRTHQPRFSVYAATKHALGAFTNILRKEVHPQRIRVTLFEPGPTVSELGSHVEPELMETLRDEMGEMDFLQAEDVAQGILWTLAAPERVNVNEVLFRPTDQRDW